MMMSLLMFASVYSKVSVVDSYLFGDAYHGRNVWGPRQLAIINRYGNNVLILRLQGFIFFFSAEMLRGTVLKFVRSCAEAKRPLSYIVLNFNMVDAIDATTAKRLRKLMRFLRHQGVTLIMTDMNSKVLSVLENEVPDPS